MYWILLQEPKRGDVGGAKRARRPQIGQMYRSHDHIDDSSRLRLDVWERVILL